MSNTISRRRLGRYAGALALAVMAGGGVAACGGSKSGKGTVKMLPAKQYEALDPRRPANFTTPLRIPAADASLFGVVDVTGPIELGVRRQAVDLVRGTSTELVSYELKAGGTSYTNPVLRVRRGGEIAARLTNTLDEATITHWHGLHVDWRNDGHPSYAIGKGGTYDYRYTVQNRAGTYWYHPHAHGTTANQAYLGLAGLLIVEDDDEVRLRQSLQLEPGVTDVPLLLQDRLFGERGDLVYPTTPEAQFQGVAGEVVLVNGTPTPTLTVDSRVYRFRVVNGSNARIYRLVLAVGGGRQPFHLIGTDGGLLAQRQQVTELFIAPAERADILVDLRTANAGDTLFLDSHAFDPMHTEMAGMATATPRAGGGMGGMNMGGGGMNGMNMGPSRLADGVEFHLLKLSVGKKVAYDLPLPAALSTITPTDTAGAPSRTVTLTTADNKWFMNGAQFEMERELFRARTNTTEVWEISNAAMSMPHPMHVHGFQFQVMERRNTPEAVRGLAVDPQGRVPTDLGWKDTVLVWPGESVKIALNFANTFQGEQLYTFHCHNLEHEDGGMMVNYRLA